MELLIVILVSVATVVVGIVGNLVASKLYDRAPSLAHWLIGRAAAHLPDEERARRFEEWLADNNDYPGKIGKAVHAVGCFIACYKMTPLGMSHSHRLSTSAAQEAVASSQYKVIVWVADDLDPSWQKLVIEKEIQHCFSVLNELKIPSKDRLVEIRVIEKSNPLVSELQAFSNIWSASIDI